MQKFTFSISFLHLFLLIRWRYTHEYVLNILKLNSTLKMVKSPFRTNIKFWHVKADCFFDDVEKDDK